MKIILSSCLLLFIALNTFSCKKSTDAAPKDYAASIKDKNWWGTLAYSGKSMEYYSVAFKADNSLTWSQLSGDTPGIWVLDGKKLSISFTGNTVQIKADISDDDKLINITDNTAASEINSGQLITTANVYLDNTVWKGSIPASSQTLKLSFTAPLKIVADAGVPFGPYPYNRIASGAAIRCNITAFGGNIFGVIVSGKEMKGTMGVLNNEWNSTLQ